MKKNLSVIFLLLGTIIGAGFCSGKEICVYFAKFGFSALYFLPLFFLLYYFMFKMFLNLGRKQDFSDFSSFNKQYGKSTFFDVSLCFTYIISSSAMFACLGEMGELYFGNIVKIFILAFAFAFCVFMLLKSFDGLKVVNLILIPIVIIVVALVCILSFFNKESFAEISKIQNAWMLFFTPVIYACQGLALSYYILIKAGKGLTKTNANIVAFVSSAILTLIVALAIIAFNLHPDVVDQSLPFVMLTFKLGFPFDLIYAPILLFAIITTLLSSTRALYDFLAKYIRNPFLRAILTSGGTLVLSFFGFDKIVESLYPLIGCLGLIVILRILFSEKQNQKSVKTSFLNKQKKM